MTENLTKKQQKALAFRAKQKGKKSGKQEVVPDDVPEQDLVDDNGDDYNEVDDKAGTAAEASKKRKRTDAAQDGEGAAVTEEGVKETKETKAAKAKGKGKAKNAWDEEGEEGAATEDGKKSKKEIKQRFILFVGNLGFKTTREEVQAHFTEAAGNKPAVRLLTTKPDPKSKQPPKSRGIAFLELPSSAAMQACLKLHHTSIQGRRINVELTAGGGGKSESRQEKIKTRNERVGGQRERRAEREKEAEGEQNADYGAEAEGAPRRQRGSKRKHDDEGAAGAEGSNGPSRQAGGSGERQVEVVRADGEVVNADGTTTKIRGGRRVKAKAPGQADGQRDAKRSRYDGGAHGGQGGQGGYGDRRGGGAQRGGGGGGGARGGGYQNRDGGRGFRPKWEPTGANAVSVG